MLSQTSRRQTKEKSKNRKLLIFFGLFILLFHASCNSEKTDLRSLAPADSLVYLETDDLGKTLETITQVESFKKLAKSKPDFSFLNDIPVAVTVTGFEASEDQVSQENSILNFKPRFTAIADSKTWNWQALSFAEEKLGQFAVDSLEGEVSMRKSEKSGGTYFIWFENNEAELFAFVKDGKIFFGNDETAIEKCLKVYNGEADSFLKLEKNFERGEKTLARGYISSDGVAQISNLAGISTAISATENDDERNFIAQIIPQIIQKSVKEVYWYAKKDEKGIEDKFSVTLEVETASILNQTLSATPEIGKNSAEFIPSDVFSVTRYKLHNPLVSWRSLLLAATKNIDEINAKLFAQISRVFLENYGVKDAEGFLAAVDSEILTINLDAEGEKGVTVLHVKDLVNVKKSVAEINFQSKAEKTLNAEIWFSEDNSKAAAFIDRYLILGEKESVLKCLMAKQSGQNFTRHPDFKIFDESKAVAVTYGVETETTGKIVEVLSELKDVTLQHKTNFLTETRFNERGFERKTVSAFGFLGSIISQL